MDKLDYKKKYKDLYLPKTKPMLIDVPKMRFITVNGSGNPNTSKNYKEAIEILYGLSFSIKMSKMNGTQPAGYFEYVIPPLEGLWYADETAFDGLNVTDKNKFKWISMIRQPEFVTDDVFETAKNTLSKKKPHLDLSKAKLTDYQEGLCVQIMHKGSYDDEYKSIELLKNFVSEKGCQEDFTNNRYHHEIYLSDPRKCIPSHLRTVIRHPIINMEI